MASLENLKAQRKTIKTSITRHETAVNNFKQGDNIMTLDARLINLTDLFQKYNDIQSQIETIQFQSSDGSEEAEAALDATNNEERNKIESQYYEIVANIKTNLLKYNPGKSDANVGQSSTVVNITKTSPESFETVTNLKPLPLPTFTGKHSEWYNFYDLFKSLVDDDQNISDIRKFHYLRSCLKDEAFRAVESLSVSASNYKSAISLLKKRFENKRLIVDEYVANILNIPEIQKQSQIELRRLLDTVNNNLAALKVFEIPIDSWDQILIPIIVNKLDFATRREWQTVLQKDLPTLSTFNEFLEKRCEILEALNVLKPHASEIQFSFKQPHHKLTNLNRQLPNSIQRRNFNKFSSNAVYTNKFSCALCKKPHNIYQCVDFLSKSVTERLKLIQDLRLCSNCLKQNHDVSTCRINSSCKTCGERHHSLVHINDYSPQSTSTSAVTLHAKNLNQVLLSTVTVLIKDNQGNFQNCRGLLDQGSQANIITTNLCDKLNLQPDEFSTCISGINLTSNHITKRVNITIKSCINDFISDISCLIIPKITEPMPAVSFHKSNIILPPRVVLSDPEFNSTREIDLLIGAELFWKILIGSPVQLNKNQPYFQQTRLGWIIGGNILITSQFDNVSCNLVSISNKETDLESRIERFWQDEEVDTPPAWSLDHLQCETQFQETTVRNRDGQFVVKLPLKDSNNVALGNSYSLAIKRFLSMERKFEKNPLLETAYKGFMTDYLNLQHMEPVSANDEEPSHIYYLPHHAVFKNTLDGPKLRVVFDASAPTSNGLSLNDNLLTGPTIQEDLFSILCRFRIYKYVLSADITKMYRMVLVNSDHQDLQRILWRDSTDQAVQIFRLKTVTYGTTCAPFLAVRCLTQIAKEIEHDFPVESLIIKRDFYMDDLLTGSNTVEDAYELKHQITNILAQYGFNLCKWTSNCKQLLPNVTPATSVNFNKNGNCKILGFHYNYETDFLKYNVNLETSVPNSFTKRTILSFISTIFDPLGLINPIIVKAKILMQIIWSRKLNWDQPVPDDIQLMWTNFIIELDELNNFKIPRSVIAFYSKTNIEFHGFSDASTKAYGACLYIKTTDESGNVSVNLLCAKSRVAPLKPITLPRLELNAAVLLIKLAQKVLASLNLTFDSRHFWTDSTIVLAWLAEASQNWKQYVGNRVALIHSFSSCDECRHVRSGDNPADIVSRGSSSQNLYTSDLWWHGPEWLKNDSSQWPKLSIKTAETVERKSQIAVHAVTHDSEWEVMTKFSSYSKLQRVMAYCLRFINNLKTKTCKVGPLSADEINSATSVIIKYIQNRAFSEEISYFQEKSNYKKNNLQKIIKLDPFLDNNGILRVGGRIRFATIMYDNKHPILLPEKHHVTNLIIKHYHETELHAGNQATLAAIRQKFWPIGGRNLVRKIIRNCICYRVHPKINHQKMGDLPRQRLQSVRPFFIAGVDYAGPFLIKEGRTRSMKKVKAYIALFVCFATKAVHIELASDLTTECFLACLKRFIARRGIVSELFSDNGTNFVGAERAFFESDKFQTQTSNFLSSKNIKFNFIPARSPHFGGLWERAVRSVKNHLQRVVGDASLTYEEFYTVLTCVEACLNSRPLIPLSNDPNDLEALTPGHFLIGAPMTSAPEDDVTSINTNRLSRWQRVQQISQHFWRRWRREYLSELQSRPKGQQTQQENIKIGSMVVLVEENLPPLRWRLGRITDIHPGSDGLVRVVTVKTINGLVKRAVNKVCVLHSE